MARPAATKPTDAELEILKVFWARGECTVRDIHDDLQRTRKVATTTVATMVQIMHDKGLLILTDERRPQKYQASKSQEETSRSMLDDLRHKLFGGSASKLISHLFQRGKASKKDIEEARKLIDKLD